MVYPYEMMEYERQEDSSSLSDEDEVECYEKPSRSILRRQNRQSSNHPAKKPTPSTKKRIQRRFSESSSSSDDQEDDDSSSAANESSTSNESATDNESSASVESSTDNKSESAGDESSTGNGSSTSSEELTDNSSCPSFPVLHSGQRERRLRTLGAKTSQTIHRKSPIRTRSKTVSVLECLEDSNPKRPKTTVQRTVKSSSFQTHSKQRGRTSIQSNSSDSSDSDGDPVSVLKCSNKSNPKLPKTYVDRTSKASPQTHAKEQGISNQSNSSNSSYSDGDENTSLVSLSGRRKYDDQKPLMIGKIITRRTETRAKWKDICRSMQTSEIDYGSRWEQPSLKSPPGGAAVNSIEDGNIVWQNEPEERFLIKWKDLSHLHCSWETKEDLESQIELFLLYLTKFIRKNAHDDDDDDDPFDPAWVTIDRILEVILPDDDHSNQLDDFGIVLNKSDKRGFKNGTGRQFLVKWENLSYTECSYEYERDLILNNVEYTSHVNNYLLRSTKPKKSQIRKLASLGESTLRKLYKSFGDNSNIEPSKRDMEIEKFKRDLELKVHKNGGQLRDYQAEGVIWMISNYINMRGFILADEMGLGKTLQTASFVNFVKTKVYRRSPVLIIAPLSTINHWKREFISWTDLNVVVYHGTAEDRRLIREHEFVYECDRPVTSRSIKQFYLKRCIPNDNDDNLTSCWMVDVVITTPEMLVNSDSSELGAVLWEIVVVDEAHRMKNNCSKLTNRMKDGTFSFNHKVLLTGTPIQNEVKEFWTLLNFVDPLGFKGMNEFLGKYGDLKTKESIDTLHDEIRPYILRRLKEDVETSVPPKEETLIEVELTTLQKQYYRALFEKNVAFLFKKKRYCDGPSLLNLAMQLRKCCNHVFLLKGVEETYRPTLCHNRENLSDADLLLLGSGKLVLLDKLLPRLKEEGHRVLIFSQFCIMLNIIEDYLHSRNMTYDRIDGKVSGLQRQQAIDRFQAQSSAFIMLLSTRAGGVGINLTAADTVIVFDSDFNPQNDLQAQARCHRIGQNKNVKVYRLVSSKTYEMRLFHISSMKLGLDQAVLKGVESGSAESTLSKNEIERLLRHGAYDIFNEEKSGIGDSESNSFLQQDIDTILQRRSRTIINENTGSSSQAVGGMFSKASFKVAKSPGASESATSVNDEIDVDDPDFWKKMLGEPKDEIVVTLDKSRRRKFRTNYNENVLAAKWDNAVDEKYKKEVDDEYEQEDTDSSVDDESQGEGTTNLERFRWGGNAFNGEWAKNDVEKLVGALSRFGYRSMSWEEFLLHVSIPKLMSSKEVKRMTFSVCLVALMDEYVDVARKLEEKLDKQSGTKVDMQSEKKLDKHANIHQERKLFKLEFDRVVKRNSFWFQRVLDDAMVFASEALPRSNDDIERIFNQMQLTNESSPEANVIPDFDRLWQLLKDRGWKADTLPSDISTEGNVQYQFKNHQYTSVDTLLVAVIKEHPDLASMCNEILERMKTQRQSPVENINIQPDDHVNLSITNIDWTRLDSFIRKYAPLQLIWNRNRSSNKNACIKLQKIVPVCGYMNTINLLVKQTNSVVGDEDRLKILFGKALTTSKRSYLPHPSWSARHDATLFLAIQRHGWIEQSSSFRDIIKDKEFNWGFPFELENAMPRIPYLKRPQDINELRLTAFRAASFVNNYKKFIDEFQGFNGAAINRAYGLVLSNNSVVQINGETPSKIWVVHEPALLIPLSESNMNDHKVIEVLPPAKVLGRRAKDLLKLFSDDALHACGSVNTSVDQHHERAILDQSDRCNVLLSEMLRGLVMAKANAQDVKNLCSFALNEAMNRVESIKSSITRTLPPEKVLSKSLMDMEKIVQQIGVAEQNISQIQQSKNIFRVILGLEVNLDHHEKNSSEGLIPDESANSPFFKNKVNQTKEDGNFASSCSIESINATDKTSGELAIYLAQYRIPVTLSSRSDRSSHSHTHNVVKLTEIEILILRVACSTGLPLLNRTLRSYASSTAYTDHQGRPYDLDWKEFGNILLKYANYMVEAQKAKGCHIEAQLPEHLSNSASDSLAIARNSPGHAEKVFNLKQVALEQAESYSKDSDSLAKKTLMTIAKLMAILFPSNSPEGFELIHWLIEEAKRWGSSLDLLNESGHLYAFTAVDFHGDVGENEERAIEVSGVMSKVLCVDVIKQVSQMSRLRSIFLLFGSAQAMYTTAERALQDLPSSLGTKQEDCWISSIVKKCKNPPLHYDLLLLERLLHVGFDDVMDNKQSYGVVGDNTDVDMSFKELGLNKVKIQKRANQLTFHLHGKACLSPSTGTTTSKSKDPSVSKNVPGHDSKAKSECSPTTTSPTGSNEKHLSAEIIDLVLDDDDDQVESLQLPPPESHPGSEDDDSSVIEVPNPAAMKRKTPSPASCDCEPPLSEAAPLLDAKKYRPSP